MSIRNIKLLLAYDGTSYAGWQRQKDLPTVQGVLEEKIGIMTGRPITLHGAGRTDAGVHALGMVANFNSASTIPGEGFRKGLNSLLPEDIRVLEVTDAGASFHARYSAKGKCYPYRLSVGRTAPPTERLYRAHLHQLPRVDEIRSCLELLLGSHDFSSFEATGSRDPEADSGLGAVREIYTAELHQEDTGPPARYCFVIRGNGFLRHMVRNIVGTLVEVGQGKRSVADFQRVLALRNRGEAGPTMPALGLFLKEVYY